MFLPRPFDYMAELASWLWFTEPTLRCVFHLKAHLPMSAPLNPEWELKLKVTNPTEAVQ